MLIQIKKQDKTEINSSRDVYTFVWKLISAMQKFDQDKEHLFVLGLNRSHYVKYIDHVSMGTMYATIAGPSEIFRNAIYLGASAIIICHNHPSGSLSPSKEDILMTKRLMEAGKLLNIEVVDHLIISEEGFYSIGDEELQ